MTDYIDRNKAINALEYNNQVFHYFDASKENIVRETVNALCHVLCDMVAADVQPVKRGRWHECYTDTHHYSGICSVCGKASIKNLTGSLYEYCPRCGARMDGGEQND